MKFEDFRKNNNYRHIHCQCCTFCKWFIPNEYDFGGKCSHLDIVGDEERYWASVDDFGLCDKFEE